MSDILTLPEAADYLRVHPSTIYRLIKRAALPAFKIGSDWRFSITNLNKWIETQSQQTHANSR